MGIFAKIHAYLQNEGMYQENGEADVDKMALRIYEDGKLIYKLARILVNVGEHRSLPKELQSLFTFDDDDEQN